MKNLTFDSQERSAILWLTTALTIFLVFWQLFREEINASILIHHALFFFCAMLVAVFLHELGHKVVAEKLGYEARIVRFTAGILTSIIIAFYTFGRIPFITGNLLSLDADPRKRLDRRRKYDNPTQQAIIAFGGIIGSIIALTLFKALWALTNYDLFVAAQFAAALHAVFSLIPFELLTFLKLRFATEMKPLNPSDGLYIIRSSHLAWTITFVFTVTFSVLSFIQTTSTLVLTILMTLVLVTAYRYITKK